MSDEEMAVKPKSELPQVGDGATKNPPKSQEAQKTTTSTYPTYPAQVPLPKLYVTKSAVKEMTVEVLAHPEIETAWGLYGFRFPNAIYVVGVIRPSNEEVKRKYATVEAGGEDMANAMRWLHANHNTIKKHVKTNIDQGKFCFLYKGHSHHTLGFDQYSSTDHSSILEAVKHDGLEVAVGPLALIRRNNSSVHHSRLFGNAVSDNRHSSVQFIFYMMTKEMVAAGYTEAVTVNPTIVNTVDTLLVPPLGWEFARNDDFKEQLRHFESFGYTVQTRYIEANGKPPLEIQFAIDSPDFRSELYITTDWNFPEVAPKIQLIPKNGSMTMAEANQHSVKEWWRKGEDFIDIIGRMKKEGCL